MLISQPISRCLTNHSKLCMSRLLNNQSRRISIYTLQRRPSFGFETSVSSTQMTSGDPVGTTHSSRETAATILRPFFRDHPGEPVPEENSWTLWCKQRLTEAVTLTIRLGATPSGLTSAHLHHPPIFFTGRIPFLPPNQQRQNTEGIMEKVSK